MPNLKGLSSFVSQLRVARTQLVDELRHVDAALAVLGKMDGGSSHTKPRHLSAAGRRKISLAQKARRAKARGQAGHSSKPRRRMSAAGRARIVAAQKARWAKVRAAKKK